VPAWIKTEYERQIGMVLLESYGLTEASPVVTIERPGMPRREGASGLTLPGMETRVVDADGRDVSPGELGELLVRGRNVMKGYFPDAGGDGAGRRGRLHTGDLVRKDADGHVYMVDRLKHVIICGGYNIYPKEVEERCTSTPPRSSARWWECSTPSGRDPEGVHRAPRRRASDGGGDRGLLPSLPRCLQGAAGSGVHDEPAPYRHREDPEGGAGRPGPRARVTWAGSTARWRDHRWGQRYRSRDMLRFVAGGSGRQWNERGQCGAVLDAAGPADVDRMRCAPTSP
jgi:acyl-CoA synthetase (AMP-forming)/AMP-acid ligase II